MQVKKTGGEGSAEKRRQISLLTAQTIGESQNKYLKSDKPDSNRLNKNTKN